MKYGKKDKPKVVVLLVLLIAVWAFIGIRFAVLSRQAEAKKAAAEARRQVAAQAVQAVQQGGQSATSPALRLAALVAPVEPPKDDPFRPVIPPRSSGSRPSRRTETILPPAPDATGYQSSNLHLTGVIIGDPSTAVLRLGDEHYVVREGDWLDNELRVHQIAQDKVTLRDGRSSYVLRLGR